MRPTFCITLGNDEWKSVGDRSPCHEPLSPFDSLNYIRINPDPRLAIERDALSKFFLLLPPPPIVSAGIELSSIRLFGIGQEEEEEEERVLINVLGRGRTREGSGNGWKRILAKIDQPFCYGCVSRKL